MPEQAPVMQSKKKPRPMFHEGRRPTWEVAYLFPEQGSWTEEEYLNLDDLYNRFPLMELSNGRLEMLPMPTQSNQLIILFLIKLLEAFTVIHAPGMVLFSGLKIRLTTGRF